MGTIIEFPKDAASRREGRAYDGPATVVILPAIRIERHGEHHGHAAVEPEPGQHAGRRKRRRMRS